jgi:hypothetical protein
VKTNQTENEAHFYATYIWKRVENTSFIVVIKTVSQVENVRVLQDNFKKSFQKFYDYHHG